MRAQRGFTLIELLVGIASFLVLLSAILAMTTVATHNQDRISKRVWANQRARPVMTQLIDALHSACVAHRVIPVQAASTSTSISFLSKSGSSVSPTPELRQVTLSGTTLNERVYPATAGAAPNWSFSTTPMSARTLLTQVSAPQDGMFRYYAFVNGQLSDTPLAVPLSATDAARTAYVTVSFVTAPSGGVSSLDMKSPITLSDSVDLRLESAGQLTTQENPPCV